MLSEDTHKGHRKRLREKFLKSGLAGFHDYEIVELLLSLGTPRRDCKPAAKEAIKRFQTLRGVLGASPQELQEIEGIGAHSTFGIKLVQEVASEFLKEKILDKPFYKSSQEVFDYLYHSMRDLKKEVFKVIYLNSQNQIIDTVDLSEGTVNSSSVSPREVIAGALKYNVMQIRVLDHIIIGDNRYFSFAGDGLIEEYELDFLNLKLRGTSEAKRRIYSARLLHPKTPGQKESR